MSSNTIKIFQQRLTNLTSRNRSLLLLRLVKSQLLDLHQLDYLEKRSSFAIIEDLILGKETIPLCSAMDSRDHHANAASHQLRQLQREDHFIFEEQGAKDLFVGYPFVQGRFNDDTLVRCPLLFFPVSLALRKNQWVLQLRPEADVAFNKSFLLAFSHYNQVSLEETLLDFDFAELGADSLTFRTELYQLLQKVPIELHFNPQTFGDRLEPFQTFTRTAFEQATETGKLKLMPEAVLGIFPQAGSYLVPDYDFLLKNPEKNTLDTLFSHAFAAAESRAAHLREEELVTPFDLDASQEAVIRRVRAGESVIVQGPPGSGKSQLICNLAIDHIARGRNVLIVCQKKAALDVVNERLSEKGFGAFAALVHDFRNDRRAIFQKIGEQIEALEQYQQENNSIDAIYLDRSFLKRSREIDQICEALGEFKQALFDIQECGLSVKELYLTANMDAPAIRLKGEYAHVRFDQGEEFYRKLESFMVYHIRLNQPKPVWPNRLSFSRLDAEDYRTIRQLLEEVQPFFRDQLQRAERLTQLPGLTVDELMKVHELSQLLGQLLALLADPTVYRFFQSTIQHPPVEYLWLANRKKQVQQAYGAEGVEKSLPKTALGTAQAVLERARKARQTWYTYWKWKWFSKEKEVVEALAQANGLPLEPDPVPALMRLLDNRLNLEHQLTLLSEIPWLIERPDSLDWEVLKHWLDQHLKAVDACKLYRKARFFRPEQLSYPEFQANILQLQQIATTIAEKREACLRYFTPHQLAGMIEGSIQPASLRKDLEAHFEALCAFDRLQEDLLPFEQGMIDKILAVGPFATPAQAVELFDNSLRLAWIDHIEAKYPVLRAVSSAQLADWERDLQAAILEKRGIGQQIALMKLRERCYAGLEYNRLNNRTTYRDLQHQVNKKRNVWPLRKLIHEFSHELLNLVPCWMASPESVSALFPMQPFFDLVIFDEASQCFAEKGIPAMFRGRQVVIAGDDQQLAPYDLYQPRWETDYEGDAALEVDSLLDLGKRFLPQVPLTGHYRSQSLELIDFSNRFFYKNKLQLVPHYQDFIRQEPAIRYWKVDGVWENNRNEEEARKVAELVLDLLAQGQESIGVITFNFKQQDLVQDVLEAAERSIPPSVFVKNIENVQGDERDHIIFSIGYAPSPSGRMSVQFGSLNQEKGENRLNVAVTRARKSVQIISSILPHQLQVDDTKNVGPKLLRDYLQFAWEVSQATYRPQLPDRSAFQAATYLHEKIQSLIAPPVQRVPIPFADLSLKQEGRYQLLLTDDHLYHQSASPKEAHGFLPIQLRAKQWPFERFFSRQYWASPQHFADTIKQVMEKGEASPEGT